MKYQKFFRASSAEEAEKILKAQSGQIFVVAGGTDIMVKARSRDCYQNQNILDISNVTEWKKIKLQENHIEIGALVTISDLLSNPLIQVETELLWKACQNFAVPQIRNRATIGGNLANGCLAADLIPALCALRAKVTVIGLKGQRTIMVSDLLKKCPACLNHEEMAVSTCFYGLTAGKKTCLNPDEIITGVIVPAMKKKYVTRFEKVGRKQAGCMSKFTVAAALWMEEENIRDIRLSIGAAFSTIQEQEAFCKMLSGHIFDKDRIKELADKLGNEIESQQKNPTSTIRYKAEVCRRLLPRIMCEMRDEIKQQKL